MCVARLFSELKSGRGVRREAIPAPMAGCNTRSGAATVTTPMRSAGPGVGAWAQARPKVARRSPAMETPMA